MTDPAARERAADTDPRIHGDEPRLVRAAASGDRDAFGRLVEEYLRAALAVAWEYVAIRDEAEDLVQEAFVRALGGLSSFDTTRPFGPWFFTILRNVARNHAEARGRWDRVPVAEDLRSEDEGPDVRAERLAFREEVAAAVELLPPMQRACFRLRDLEGFEAGEVADMLGIAAPTVRVHLHRARRALRVSLEPHADEVMR